MQSRARSSYAEPQPSLAMHLKMHRKGTTFALRLTNDSSDIFEEKCRILLRCSVAVQNPIDK
jgi:hypothetical protein